VKLALAHNAAAVILCHNHPSGSCLPSGDDLSITTKIKEVLKVVDVQVLDHFIVGCGEPYSFAAHGQI
jgi:DNA repair protein RadC